MHQKTHPHVPHEIKDHSFFADVDFEAVAAKTWRDPPLFEDHDLTDLGDLGDFCRDSQIVPAVTRDMLLLENFTYCREARGGVNTWRSGYYVFEATLCLHSSEENSPQNALKPATRNPSNAVPAN